MIDCESEIISIVTQKLHETYPGLYVTGEYVRTPAQFPCVSIEQRDSAAWRNSRNTVSNENHVAVMFEVNVYSNKQHGKKSECKEIMGAVDAIMTGISLGFTRTMLSPMQNIADATIYRMVARYSGIIGIDAETNKYVVFKR